MGAGGWGLGAGYWILGAGCPEKPEIFDFIVFRGSSILGTRNRDRIPDEAGFK
jgi:hypothetical protein